MRKTLVHSTIFALAMMLPGCATMFSGGNDSITLESEPSQATVTTQNGMTLGTTPLTTSLKPDDYILTFSREGYTPATYALSRTVDGVAFLNLLCVLCWGIDFATGALWGLDDDFVRVTLNSEGESAAAEGNEPLTRLACSNYSALDESLANGMISPEEQHAANRLIAHATLVTESECSRMGSLIKASRK